MLIAFNGVSDGHVIVIDGCHIVSMFYDTPPDYSAYLYDAVINSGVYANLINEALGPIEAFTWSRDVGDTYVSVNRLSVRLEEISNLCIEQNKPFVILSHSWGTVLAYLALKKNPKIHVDKLITMGSPLDSITPGVWELTHNYVQDFIYFNHFELPYVNEWKNYWAVYDWISGSIPGTSNIKITSSFFDVLGHCCPVEVT